MIILCCGDRKWTDRDKIAIALSSLTVDDHVIHGNAPGADRLCAEYAIPHMTVESFPANWSRYGRAAGPIRNQLMLDEGQPDLVLAFHSDIEHSKGTADMIRRAKKANIPVKIVV